MQLATYPSPTTGTLPVPSSQSAAETITATDRNPHFGLLLPLVCAAETIHSTVTPVRHYRPVHWWADPVSSCARGICLGARHRTPCLSFCNLGSL